MANHIIDNVNHNDYWDDVTLSGTCTYVVAGEGCTGTISNCSFIEIKENNTNLELNNCQYVTMGEDNDNIHIQNSDYVIIGTANSSLYIGQQRNTDRFTGISNEAHSITVPTGAIDIDVTGARFTVTNTAHAEIDGYANKLDECNSIILQGSSGNEVAGASVIDASATTDCYIYADKLSIKGSNDSTSFNRYKDVLKATPRHKQVELQSDSTGLILDRPNNKIVNSTPKGNEYILVNGQWVQTI